MHRINDSGVLYPYRYICTATSKHKAQEKAWKKRQRDRKNQRTEESAVIVPPMHDKDHATTESQACGCLRKTSMRTEADIPTGWGNYTRSWPKVKSHRRSRLFPGTTFLLCFLILSGQLWPYVHTDCILISVTLNLLFKENHKGI